MKKVFFLMYLLISAVCLFAASKSNKNTKYMFVAVEELQIKNKPAITGKGMDMLDYGDRVIVIDEKGSWYKIKAYENDSVEGWVNSSSLTKKKIIVDSQRTTTNASELALAGKGFNSAIEAAYEEEFEVDFTLVDAIEASGVSEEETIAFISEGNLRLAN